jgi:hypothetical protein
MKGKLQDVRRDTAVLIGSRNIITILAYHPSLLFMISYSRQCKAAKRTEFGIMVKVQEAENQIVTAMKHSQRQKSGTSYHGGSPPFGTPEEETSWRQVFFRFPQGRKRAAPRFHGQCQRLALRTLNLGLWFSVRPCWG